MIFIGMQMKKIIILSSILLFTSFLANASNGVVKHQSKYSVEETANRFEQLALNKGMTIFTRINHSQNARNINLELRPTEVIIFGNPKIGTRLMQCNQNSAIDLPQKVLISKDASNKVWLSYNDPNYLIKRHDIKDCDGVANKISSVLNKLSQDATSQTTLINSI
jgi:uncharacterized protein (DUF302 family)